MSARGAHAGGARGDLVGPVFAALADPTRRTMLQAILDEGTASVPSLAATLPITRQAVAKHLATLDHAGLIERTSAGGRTVRYRLRPDALTPAAVWLRDAELAWEQRLGALKRTVEG